MTERAPAAPKQLIDSANPAGILMGRLNAGENWTATCLWTVLRQSLDLQVLCQTIN